MAVAWLLKSVVLAVHEEQLGEHGGLSGLRDEARLDAALHRPRHRLDYSDQDVFGIAAAYGFGICQGHPFVDGNKRTSLVAVELFLMLHGYELFAHDAECVMTWLALTEGEIDEPALAQWLRTKCRPAQ